VRRSLARALRANIKCAQIGPAYPPSARKDVGLRVWGSHPTAAVSRALRDGRPGPWSTACSQARSAEASCRIAAGAATLCAGRAHAPQESFVPGLDGRALRLKAPRGKDRQKVVCPNGSKRRSLQAPSRLTLPHEGTVCCRPSCCCCREKMLVSHG
jgi:hypothetical protein